jgi:DNA replication and repair protein RecF
MYVATLTLDNFRNHRATRITAGHGLVVLAGENGAGKTNILEALSLLAPGRGLRGSALPDMAREGDTDGSANSEGFTISADCRTVADDLPPLLIGTAMRPSAPGRRRVRINGAESSATALGEWLALVWLTPAMDRLFVDAASQRRRFLDRMTLALRPDHARHATRYDAAMRARGRLLADEGPVDWAWVAALEAQMADHGAALDGARHAMVDALSAELAQTADGPFARPQLQLVGADGAPAQPWGVDALVGALAKSRAVDARAGRALAGPHRADLSVTHAAKGQAAARCSTGEQKALLLSIVLAHGDRVASARGQRPIILLDELAAHLDPVRRALLFARLEEGGGQVWMTGTEMALFDAVPAGATRLTIAGGNVA